MIRRTSALLVVFLLLFASLLPLAQAKKGGGNGNGRSAEAREYVKQDKAARRVEREARYAAKREAKRAKKAVKLERRLEHKRRIEEKQAAKGLETSPSAESSPSTESSPSVETKLTGRYNAFNRILNKLWRMPDSALKGLLNALTNIGKWIGLVPPPIESIRGGSTETTPAGSTDTTPTTETTPTPDTTPTF